mmetsp:Transcript_33977/g.59200  ORF Transcript_33977/g.59200 Transcript_33977/m.59200 type:complete len:803 (+) Transcript_33977:3150-5558(+)
MMDEQQRIDELQDEILAQKKALDKKKAKAKSLSAEKTVLMEQLSYLRQQVKLKDDEIKTREEKLIELKEREGAKRNVRNFTEKDRKRKDFDMQVSNLFSNFINANRGFTDCEVARPNSIKVKFLKDAKDGEPDSLDNATLYEAKFRINKDTTLIELKNVACSFWGIQQTETMALRESNLAMIDLFENQKVQDLLFKELLSDELYLFEINRQATNCFSQQEDCYAESAVERRQKTKKIKRSSIPKADLANQDAELEIMYKSFEEAYAGLKSFREPEDEDVEQFKSERTTRRDASLLRAIMMILMLGCTLSCVLIRRQVTRDFWIQAGVHSQLLQNFEGDDNFFDINTIDDLNTFVITVFAPLFFEPDRLVLVEPFNRRYEMIGPIRFRQQRVKYKDCDQDGYDIVGECIESVFNDDTEFTDTIVSDDETMSWEHSTASDNDIKSIVNGQLSYYGGSGYVVDFSPTTTVTDFTDTYTSMISNGWYEINSQNLFINVIMYSASYDIWINVTILFEFTLTNYVLSTRLTAEVFSPNLFGQRADRLAAQILDILRFVMSFYIIYEIVMTVKDTKKGGRNWKHLISTLGLIDIATWILILASFSMSYELSEDDEALFNDNEFFDAEFYSYNYKICMIINAAVILLIMLRLVFCFRLSRSVHIHLYTIEKASKNVLSFLLILLPIIIGFVILMMNIYGTTIRTFRNFEQTLLRILLLISGYGDILVMLLHYRIETVILWLVYFFGVLFFLISAFMGIYMDAYRQTKMLSGKDDMNCPKAGKQMYTDWVKASLPGFLKRRCFKGDQEEEQ